MRATTDWLYVSVWSLFVFASIPVARTLQSAIRAHLGREAFLYGVMTVILVSSLGAASWLRFRHTRAAPANYLWLAGVTLVFVAYTWHLRSNPEEAMHFIQYGVLALLVYRALTHHITDTGIYVAAALVTAAIGIVDEALQWLTPGRVWGLADIWLNSFAALLTLLGVALGIRPTGISGPPGRSTLRILCRAALVIVALLGLSLLNTPQRISRYVEAFPALDFIVDHSSVMAEYGYRYSDQQALVFRSRLAPDDLRHSDRTRASEAAKKLDSLPALTDYKTFLRLYTPFTDPFLHEARVHLNRRDYYLQTAPDYQHDDRDEFRRRMTIAHFENKIMEDWFTESLARSGFQLPESTVAAIRENAMPDTDYESPVSKALLTRINEQQVLWTTLLLAVALIGAEHRFSKTRRS
ncbi:MAG: VanZ family protein [Thiogranum sp.]|nr:VanZ family protein [Thiogranum sp.]